MDSGNGLGKGRDIISRAAPITIEAGDDVALGSRSMLDDSGRGGVSACPSVMALPAALTLFPLEGPAAAPLASLVGTGPGFGFR